SCGSSRFVPTTARLVRGRLRNCRRLEQAERVAVEILEDRLNAVGLLLWLAAEADAAPFQRLIVGAAVVGEKDPGGSLANALADLLGELLAVHRWHWRLQEYLEIGLPGGGDGQPAHAGAEGDIRAFLQT